MSPKEQDTEAPVKNPNKSGNAPVKIILGLGLFAAVAFAEGGKVAHAFQDFFGDKTETTTASSRHPNYKREPFASSELQSKIDPDTTDDTSVEQPDPDEPFLHADNSNAINK